jgi:superfamily II DNA or RNA helicase
VIVGVFLDLFARLDPDPRVRGNQFEHVCKWFLTNDPTYKSTLRRVWLWDEWSGRWGGDAGIDLVAEDYAGRLWAIQSKAYSPENAVTKADVDKFLSESSRSVFSYRLLIATTDKLHHVARRTIDDQEKQVAFVGLSDLLTSEVNWRTNPLDMRPSPPPKPAKPREHQREAIRAVLKGFTKSDRGQLIMACGTGKTLTSLFVNEKLAAERTLVLVPSLSLLKQTMQEWTVNRRVPFEPLPVCSDQTVGKSDDDAAVAHTSELGVPVTTDPHDIAAFLRRRSGPRVVFSTYQSSPQIAAAFAVGRVPAFDLVIADEAHRVAGIESSTFGTVLDQAAIKARRRLFMTATPRYFTGRVLKAAQEADFEVASMDDRSKFGTVFHRLSFGEAIERELLTEYQVAVMGVDNGTYREWAERGTLVARDGEEITDARTLAGQIGLAKAMRKYDLRRNISFHSRIARAREFAAEMSEVIAWMPARERPKGALWARHASGEMSAGERHVLLRHLSQLDNGERGLLTNARCLSEGVDVPTLDGVAFIDPRRSEVDIVQAVGRAIRKSEGKTVGTIVIPVFIDTDTNPEVALNDSSFKPVWDVIQALRAHDQELGEQIDALRREMGRRGVPKLPDKIHVDLPLKVGADFADAFDVRLLQKTSAPWESWLGLMDDFINENEHSRVPADYAVRDHKLGMWVSTQRHLHGRGQLSAERIETLEALPGWSWDPVADSWTQHYNGLKAFVEREGHARPSQTYVENGLRLGQWVAVQRNSRMKTSPERVALLEALPGWSWNPYEDQWEEGFTSLLRFVEREGHAGVPKGHIEDAYDLGRWTSHQRSKRRSLTDERRKRLEAQPGWSWDLRADMWQRKFDLLRGFQQRQGHARVPQGYVEDGVKLGTWVLEQRNKRSEVSEDRRKLLESVPGWTWDPHTGAWERGYTALTRFADREGHARVPRQNVEDGFRLGDWVAEQRSNQENISDERRDRLESAPGWSWNAVQDSWLEHLERLKAFAEREGHTRVPVDYVENGMKLGQWTRLRRREHRKLSPDRQALLEAIPGWYWGRSADHIWDQKFALMKKFVDREGHARVPSGHVEDGVKLGSWVTEQRSNRDTIAPDRIEQLEALPGWSWTVSDDTWDERYDLLCAFAEREGHARVPQQHVENGVRLGGWVGVQRQKRGSLSRERRARLESVSGWSWDARR